MRRKSMQFRHCRLYALVKGLITVGRELRQQHPSDLLSGAGTSRGRSSRDVPAGQQNTLYIHGLVW